MFLTLLVARGEKLVHQIESHALVQTQLAHVRRHPGAWRRTAAGAMHQACASLCLACTSAFGAGAPYARLAPGVHQRLRRWCTLQKANAGRAPVHRRFAPVHHRSGGFTTWIPEWRGGSGFAYQDLRPKYFAKRTLSWPRYKSQTNCCLE